MLQGPNLEATAALASRIDIPVILSGGVTSSDDLVAAAGHQASGVSGAIVGRALYTGAIDLADALARIEGGA
jgi:phosphoribosylformimino-5-aminoimidazole carboxamide ribotide isomerase